MYTKWPALAEVCDFRVLLRWIDCTYFTTPALKRSLLDVNYMPDQKQQHRRGNGVQRDSAAADAISVNYSFRLSLCRDTH